MGLAALFEAAVGTSPPSLRGRLTGLTPFRQTGVLSLVSGWFSLQDSELLNVYKAMERNVFCLASKHG
jgi:hypothetical protein